MEATVDAVQCGVKSSTSRGWAWVATWRTLVEGDDIILSHCDFSIVAEAIIFSKESNSTVAGGHGADLQE